MVVIGLGFGIVGLLGSAFVVYLHEQAGSSEWWLVGTLALLGVGQGLVVSPNQTLTLADVPLRYAGSAGGILQTGQRLGTAIGIVVITGIAFSVVAARGWDEGFIYGLLVITIFAAAAAAVAFGDMLLSRRTRR